MTFTDNKYSCTDYNNKHCVLYYLCSIQLQKFIFHGQEKCPLGYSCAEYGKNGEQRPKLLKQHLHEPWILDRQ